MRVRNLILRLALPNPWRPEIPVDNVVEIEDDHFALDAFRIRYPEVDSGTVIWAIKEHNTRQIDNRRLLSSVRPPAADEELPAEGGGPDGSTDASSAQP